MVRNLEIICRVCLRKCKNRHVSLHDTFTVDIVQELVLYAKAYTTCTQLEVVADLDGLPEWLCNTCSRDLQYVYEFRLKALQGLEKLDSQISKQKLENTVRAVSPSEFELPDNNAAVAYIRADADMFDACTSQMPKFLKDPLEDSESDNEMQSSYVIPDDNLDSPVSTHSNLAYDSEDDKPLKDLINSTKRPTQEITVLDKSDKGCTKSELVLPNEHLLYDDDEFRGEENVGNEKIADAIFTPEAHIFPKGRFKCAVCEQNYFTSKGLNAHMEVHLMKRATVKKKRARNKQRKISKKRNMLLEGHIVDESCDYSNLQADDSNEKLESVVNQNENQQIAERSSKIRKSKEPKPKRMFPCHVCGKHMISASKLRYHMVMHTGEKDYLCTMCPKAYSTIYALKHHIRTHTGERPYECKFCGDRFLRPTTLKSHQRRHTGERPYGCDICGKRFIQHSSMTTHMKLNHMDKTIQCPHCDKKYARQTDLNTHLLSHTGDKPYPCQLCPSRFVRQANLNKHMNQQHTGRTCTKSDERDVMNLCSSQALTDNENDFIVRHNSSVRDIMDNCCNSITSQNVNNIRSDQVSHMLTVESFEQFGSADLVPWNC